MSGPLLTDIRKMTEKKKWKKCQTVNAEH